MNKKSEGEYSDKEAKARFEAALKGAMNTPHKPLKNAGRRKKPNRTRGDNAQQL